MVTTEVIRMLCDFVDVGRVGAPQRHSQCAKREIEQRFQLSADLSAFVGVTTHIDVEIAGLGRLLSKMQRPTFLDDLEGAV